MKNNTDPVTIKTMLSADNTFSDYTAGKMINNTKSIVTVLPWLNHKSNDIGR